MMQGIQPYMFEPLKKDYPNDDSDKDRYYSDSDANGSDYEPPDPREEYSDGLLRQLKRFQGKATFSDVTIKVEGTEFHGHRCVLAAASTYFEDMFSAGLKESDAVVELTDVDADVFKKIWKFIYTGGMDVDKDTMRIFKASLYLGLRDVERVFMNHFLEGLKWGDVGAVEALAIWPTVKDSDMSRLRAGVVKHLLEDFQKIVKSDVDQFVERAPSQLINGYLKDFTKYLTPDLTEVQLLTCIVRWLKHDWEKRKRHAYKFLKKFRLSSLPKDVVQQLIDAEILEIPECKKMVEDLMQK